MVYEVDNFRHRRISAISFLANIDSFCGTSDQFKLDVLKNTHVLSEYRRNKRILKSHEQISKTGLKRLDSVFLNGSGSETFHGRKKGVCRPPRRMKLSETTMRQRQWSTSDDLFALSSSNSSIEDTVHEGNRGPRVGQRASSCVTDSTNSLIIRQIPVRYLLSRGGKILGENSTKEADLNGHRLVMLTSKPTCCPFAIFSSIKFASTNLTVAPVHKISTRSSCKRLSPIQDGGVKEINDTTSAIYGHLLEASAVDYSPHLLEGWLIAGRHRTYFPFRPAYVTSIIGYAKEAELKRELNDKFRLQFPFIHLTYSKLKSLKREILTLTSNFEDEIRLCTVATAYVYFEMLVLKQGEFIEKSNRKLYAGACLLLAAKLNDFRGVQLSSLIERIETGFRLNRKDFMEAEFSVLIILGFGLFVPSWYIYPHYQRLLQIS